MSCRESSSRCSASCRRSNSIANAAGSALGCGRSPTMPWWTGPGPAGALLESHLRDCDSCRRRLDVFRSDLEALRSVPIGARPADAPASRPATIGKYLVVGVLGSGGQAQVFRAIHPTLDTELAIKLS